MIRKKKDEIEWLEFEILSEERRLTHAIFLRQGGVSKGMYASLNTLRGTGDDLRLVDENRKRILSTLKLDKVISAHQTHSARVECMQEFKAEVEDCDGLMTAQKHWGLLIGHADCQAAIFYDPIHHAVANVHAGWRGQVKNIYRETVLKMMEAFKTRPEDLLVGISPSLGPENSEFKNFQKELPESFLPFQFKPTYFDLWAIAKHQLEECGILPHHIEIAKMNTYAHPDLFFSYRRERDAGGAEKVTGGHATVVALR